MAEERRSGEEQPYVEPAVLATYSKEKLEETIRPHGPDSSYDTGGCGPGCGIPPPVA